MTESEAINELQSNIDLPFGFTVSDEVSEIAIKALEEIKQYRAIGTVEELQALKEKNEAKKVQYDEYGKEEGYPYCKCGKCLIDDLVGVSYCPNCGQKLDWE